jgi:thymidylate synthase
VKLLKNDPTTRQAYLPIWFECDGQMAYDNRRVPCTLGYHFIQRDGVLHCFYPMRSVDALRHFHNDVYFANRLTKWIIEQCGWNDVQCGDLTFQAVSFHCFQNDEYALKKLVVKS